MQLNYLVPNLGIRSLNTWMIKDQAKINLMSVAPMMGWSTGAMEEVMRVVSPKATFFSQMFHINAIINHPHFISEQYSPNTIIQIGGCCPNNIKQACKKIKGVGFSRVNMNFGCPSPKVQKGGFGAYLMKEHTLAKHCIESMLEVFEPHQVSIKCRIGVDEYDSDMFLKDFIQQFNEIGIQQFIIHARIAKLTKFNPKQNRNIPPLNYPRVYRMIQAFPNISFIMNGGIKTIEDAVSILDHADGIMIGRLCYEDLYQYHLLYAAVYQQKALTREALLLALKPSVKHYLYINSLYKGIKYASHWKKLLREKSTISELARFSKEGF